MKKAVFLKSTLRQPFRSLFLIFLVGAISFAFAGQIGGSMLIDQRVTQIGRYYRSLGQLESLGGDTSEIIRYLEADPRVATINQLSYLSGVLQDDVCNAEMDDRSSYGPAGMWNDVFFYGILTEPTEEDGSYYYCFRVDKVLAGYPEYISEGTSVIMISRSGKEGDEETLDTIHHQLEVGGRYLIRGTKNLWDPLCTNPMGPTNQFLLKALSRTADCKEFDFPDRGQFDVVEDRYYMQNGETAFLPAPVDLDLTMPEYAAIYKELQAVRANQRAVGMVAITDVSAYSNVQEENRLYNLIDGRWPSKEDTTTGKRVCTIPQVLAETRGLQVGDTIEITLRDIPTSKDGRSYEGDPSLNRRLISMPGGYIIGPIDPIERNSAYTEECATEKYEIVGIYLCTDFMVPNYLFTSLSAIPENWFLDREIDGLVLTSPSVEDSFLNETRDDLQSMGWRVTFYKNESANFFSSANAIEGTARNNIYIFAVILIACLCFAGFVYFRFRRRDLAISRALGVTVRQCVLGISIPFLVLGGVGAGGGVAAAWWYVGGHTEELLSAFTPFARGDEVVTLSAVGAVGIWLSIFFLVAAITLAFAIIQAKKPPFLMLQGGRNKR